MAESRDHVRADATPAPGTDASLTDAPLTDAPLTDAPRPAVLVHAADAVRRRAWRAALQPLGLRVLLSGREAEAAKCLADAELVLVVAVDAPAMRTTLGALRPELPVCWLGATAASDDAALSLAVRIALTAATRAASELIAPVTRPPAIVADDRERA